MKGTMIALLFDLEDYATTYRATRDAYLNSPPAPTRLPVTPTSRPPPPTPTTRKCAAGAASFIRTGPKTQKFQKQHQL
jgi:hypothetical protein